MVHYFDLVVKRLQLKTAVKKRISCTCNQKFRNFQSRPLYIKNSVLPAYRKPSIKSDVYYAKNCFRIFYFGIFHPFRIFYFAVLLLFRTFCNTSPRFCTKNPAPEITEAEQLLISDFQLCVLVKTCDLKCITGDKKLFVCRNYPYFNLAVGSRDFCELAL